VLNGLETEAREVRKGLWLTLRRCRRGVTENQEARNEPGRRLFVLTQTSKGGDRHAENVLCLHPATIHTTQPGMELREAGHDYPG
jgi:hypothetical protein